MVFSLKGAFEPSSQYKRYPICPLCNLMTESWRRSTKKGSDQIDIELLILLKLKGGKKKKNKEEEDKEEGQRNLEKEKGPFQSPNWAILTFLLGGSREREIKELGF
ncbi:hypothetical protein PanWU01x14_318510 [Parasponia andersonii]|uniref:Uncharacterized protein n=1 Tax=Parasponia andersonii TaxID=3476 RepID=A0A2P5AMC2_PARAD|nr:hypothetical protein PanWU01x14_318510 [Parasponia andersonii]